MKSKAESLIGFAVKARKVTYGIDNIVEKRGIRLIICGADLAENSLKKLKIIAESTKIPLLISHLPLENIVYKQGVKAIAITDRQMSQAIINNISDNFKAAFFDGGNTNTDNGLGQDKINKKGCTIDGCKTDGEDKPVD